jgi:hypothetical protein
MAAMKDPRWRAYLGLGLVAAGLAGVAVSGDLVEHATRFRLFYGLSGAGFALLATAAARLPLRAALVAAVLLRLLFLPVVPSLSDDYHRYIWDGRVQLEGVNPYLYEPRAPIFDDVPYAGRGLINHPELRTVYPPLLQASFLGVAAVDRAVRGAWGGGGAAGGGAGGGPAGAESLPGGSPIPFKLLFGAFDLATAAAVWWLAGARRRAAATVLYLLCPAVILQTWESVHVEAAAVFFVVLAAALLVHRRDASAGVALGLAVALKVTPLALLAPALLGGRAKPARLLAGFVPALVIPYVPYLLTGGAFGSLWEAGTGWTGSAMLFSGFTRVTSREAALALCLGVVSAGTIAIALRLRGRENTARAFTWVSALVVLCLPVVHAWYWLPPLALGLAAGVWLPVAAGVLAPLATSLPRDWPHRSPFWQQAAAPGGLLARRSDRRRARTRPSLSGMESVAHTGGSDERQREPG